MTKQKHLLSILLSASILVGSCTRVPDQIEPQVDYVLQDRYILQLPNPFPPLTIEEQSEGWVKEYQIGMGFARELDLYQAITAFKRASFLLDPQERKRKAEMHYEVLLCYYIGKKYQEAAYTFENSDLHFVDSSFPAYEDLLTILFDCYTRLNEVEKADKFLEYLNTHYPQMAEKLTLSTNLQKGNIEAIEAFAKQPEYEYLTPFLEGYESAKKSISKAQTLNAIIPGAGYFYIGQKSSALTAFY